MADPRRLAAILVVDDAAGYRVAAAILAVVSAALCCIGLATDLLIAIIPALAFGLAANECGRRALCAPIRIKALEVRTHG
jgi:hypothetical protein